jgi:hypothetical protein
VQDTEVLRITPEAKAAAIKAIEDYFPDEYIGGLIGGIKEWGDASGLLETILAALRLVGRESLHTHGKDSV